MKKKEKKQLIAIIRSSLLPVFLGLAAGLSGGVMAYSYLTISLNQLPESQAFGRAPSAVTAPLPEAELAERLKHLTLPVFRSVDVGVGELANRTMLPQEAVGMATVITSDGWLLTHKDIARGNVLIGLEGKLKTPQKRVDDPRTGLVFLKIENGPLQVSGFEETDIMAEGASLYAQDAGGSFTKTFFSGTKYPDNLALRSSEAFSRQFLLDREYASKAYGGAVVTAGGNLAGILSPVGFLPIHMVRPVLSDAFRGQELERASLGIRYISLGGVYIGGEQAEASSGARVTSSPVRGLSAVKALSAASEAGLKEGDIILRVDDKELTVGADLAEVIAEYRPENQARLEILRDGERRFVEVTFK